MDLNGSIRFNSDLKNVFSFFSDLSRLIPCLPNLVDYELINKNTARAKFKANIGSISILSYLSRVTANVIMQLIESDETNNQIRYSFNGSAAGLNYNGNILLKLGRSSEDNVTNVNWYASVDIGKVVDMLAKFVNINSIINNIINDIVNTLSQCVH